MKNTLTLIVLFTSIWLPKLSAQFYPKIDIKSHQIKKYMF